ncbi:YwgA family protein [Terribacillus saccharophilus]|uniref:YwgA family protein n=1 Tax=Terribacillus saccharophilus TaxID=361277 RepID=UPI002DC4B35F|nr:YwgA family protein [Terribacillus saccharophilus]
MLANHANLLQFFSSVEEVVGRKKLQKMIYILKKNGIPFGEKYEFHLFGPYSEELSLRVDELSNLGLIKETKEDKSSYFQYRYTITEEGQQFLSHYDNQFPDYQASIHLLKEKSSRFLELVSTMLYFEELPQEEVEDKVRTVKKKQNYTDEEMTQAWEFISSLKKQQA